MAPYLLIADARSPLVPIALIAIIATVVTFFIVHAVRDSRRRRELWRSYADARGFRYSEQAGPWYRRSGPSIHSARDGAEIMLDHYVVSTGKSSVPFTRLRGTCHRAPTARLSLSLRSFLTSIGRAMGVTYLESGDRAFDERFAIRGLASGPIDAIFDARTRERLAAVPRRFQLKLKDGQAVMNWSGWETREPMLDAAIDAMTALCRPEARQR
jgi:hypothetical protein